MSPEVIRFPDFEKSGGFEKTIEDFNALNPSNVRDIQTQWGPGKVGTLSNKKTLKSDIREVI